MPTADDQASDEGPISGTVGLDSVEDLDALTESQFRAAVVRNFSAGAARMDGMEMLIADNTAMTRATWDNTAEIRDIVIMGRSFFSGLGKFARGLAKIWVVLRPVIQACTMLAGAYIAVKGAIWAATHGGSPPK